MQPKDLIDVRRRDTIKARARKPIEALEKCLIEAPSPRNGFYLKFEISNFKCQISNFKFEILPLCLLLALFLSACGYHVGGTASQLPPGLKVIAVPALKNDTPRYRIEQRMTEAVVHEFIARTKYRIVSSEESADAVLHGEITSFEAIPAVFDTTPTTTSSVSDPNMLVPPFFETVREDESTRSKRSLSAFCN
jgi:hypothetical protein